MLSIIIPALNEEKNIEKTVLNVIMSAKSAGINRVELIVVDDGSRDNTPEILKRLKRKYRFIHVITHEKNLGLGISVRDAIKKVNFSQFMIVPGDNDGAKELLKKLMQNRNKADLVLSYFLNKEGRSKKRNVYSSIYQLFYMCFFDIFIQYQNGINIYPTNIVRKFDLKAKRFSIIAELVVKTLCSGSSFCEVAGYMQTGEDGSKSLNWKSLVEVTMTFLRLIYEIKIRKRQLYSHKPVRIYL